MSVIFFHSGMVANAFKSIQVAKFSKDSIHEVSKVLIGGDVEGILYMCY